MIRTIQENEEILQGMCFRHHTNASSFPKTWCVTPARDHNSGNIDINENVMPSGHCDYE